MRLASRSQGDHVYCPHTHSMVEARPKHSAHSHPAPGLTLTQERVPPHTWRPRYQDHPLAARGQAAPTRGPGQLSPGAGLWPTSSPLRGVSISPLHRVPLVCGGCAGPNWSGNTGSGSPSANLLPIVTSPYARRAVTVSHRGMEGMGNDNHEKVPKSKTFSQRALRYSSHHS